MHAATHRHAPAEVAERLHHDDHEEVPPMSDILLVEPSRISPTRRALGVVLRSREVAVAAVLVGVVVLTTLKSASFLFSATAGATCCSRPRSCCCSRSARPS